MWLSQALIKMISNRNNSNHNGNRKIHSERNTNGGYESVPIKQNGIHGNESLALEENRGMTMDIDPGQKIHDMTGVSDTFSSTSNEMTHGHFFENQQSHQNSLTTTLVIKDGDSRGPSGKVLHKDTQLALERHKSLSRHKSNVSQDPSDVMTIVSMSDCESRTSRSLSPAPSTSYHANNWANYGKSNSNQKTTKKPWKSKKSSLSVCNPSHTTVSNTNNFQDHDSSLRPILVGYAFGPKKMSTMSIVMAEASKAVSTVVTTHIPSSRLEKRKRKKVINTHGIPQNQNHTLDENACISDDSHRYSSPQYKRQKQMNSYSNSITGPLEDDDCCSINTSVEVDSMMSMTWAGSTFNETSSANAVSCILPKSCSSICSSTNNTIVGSASSTTSNAFPGTYIQIPQHYQPMRVSFVPLDLNSPLEDQHGGKFDAILHKMTEDILWKSQLSESSSRYVDEYLFPSSSSSSSNTSTSATTSSNTSTKLEKSEEAAMKRIQRLLKYKDDHPACFLADHPANVEAIMNRSKIAQTLTQCLRGVVTKSGIAVRTPRYLVLTKDDDDASISKRIDDAPFTYPFIIKPLPAAGTAESHHMGILLGRKGIAKIHTPCLLQEYTNHDETLYKVYVLGRRVWVFDRQSLPNLPIGESMSSDLAHHYVNFDSQKQYPKISDFGVIQANTAMNSSCTNTATSSKESSKSDHNSTNSYNKNDTTSACNNNKKMTEEEIHPVADCIRRAFGLDLFGFDLLVTKYNDNTKEMFVVDVNYFPSYKEVKNFSELLAEYLAQCGIEGRVRSFDAER